MQGLDHLTYQPSHEMRVLHNCQTHSHRKQLVGNIWLLLTQPIYYADFLETQQTV